MSKCAFIVAGCGPPGRPCCRGGGGRGALTSLPWLCYRGGEALCTTALDGGGTGKTFPAPESAIAAVASTGLQI